MKNLNNDEFVDVLGVGFGPSNIALAIAHEEMGSDLNLRFIEASPGPAWHPQMLLNGSDIQNNPLRDLVTPRNPKSHYSFINFLKEKNRLFDYLNLGLHYPLRKEYAQYVTWVATHFAERVSYNSGAISVRIDADSNLWVVKTASRTIRAQALVLGMGRSRSIPKFAKDVLGKRVFHLCDYLGHLDNLGTDLKNIAVIGASQSSVEVILDMIPRLPETQIHAVHRSFSMRQKDTSPFSDLVYFPEFVDYFFEVGEAGRQSLQKQLRRTNYSAADHDVLHKLMLTMYEEQLDGRDRIHIHNNVIVEGLTLENGSVAMQLKERHLGEPSRLNVDAVVLATGFRDIGSGENDELYPPLLTEVAPHLARRSDKSLKVERDYRVACDAGLNIYLNGLCESSHGLGDAGSFSLLSIRSNDILESMHKNIHRYLPAEKVVVAT